MSSVHDFSAINNKGLNFPLKQFKGKALLIVNVACVWGSTKQGYEDLDKVVDKFPELGIVGFPCNQLGLQEPGSNAEIAEWLGGGKFYWGVTNKSFKVRFPIMSKIDVNGTNAHPLYTYMRKNAKGFVTNSDDIKWNFEGFLIGKDGKVIQRIYPAKDSYGKDEFFKAVKSAMA